MHGGRGEPPRIWRMDAPLLTRLDPRKVRVRVAMMPPPLTRFLFARWGKNCQRLQPLVHAMPHWRRPANEITEPSFAHNVYYVQYHQSAWVRLTSLAADIAGSESSPHERPISHVLSAANLGRLVRQLVAIDALSYVRSQ